MTAHSTSTPTPRPSVDLDETRRRFLLAREQIAAHAPGFSPRQLSGWSPAPGRDGLRAA
jgi:hypothetical protein